MAATENRILKKLLDRLFAALVNGPSLNCRPHASRQRIDLAQIAKLNDRTPEQVLRDLLGPDRQAKVTARVAAPRPRGGGGGTSRFAVAPLPEEEADDDLSPEDRAARKAYAEQQSVFGKLRTIADDARTYENDTGAHALQVGFPLLSLPPGPSGGLGLTRRILAPLAFASLSVAVKSGAAPSATLECRNEGRDLIVPNAALLAWLERQTGQAVGSLFDDEAGERPWAEVATIVRRVCQLLQIDAPPAFAGDEMPDDFALLSAPRSDDDEPPSPRVIAAAVVGLYPMANQGLLRDMQALAGGEPVTGPIESFVKVGVSLDATPAQDGAAAAPAERHTRAFAEERLVAAADPCQARAVRLARTSRGLVIHGPPGTGKSQTIANVIGDHLARGERVLFVCDKRTALDVVMNRLDGMGLGSLCGIVHDPQRDQRELYKSIREQLDALPDLRTDAAADGRLAKVDAELQRLHGELTEYHGALMKRPDKDSPSFHELAGRWLGEAETDVELDAKLLEGADFHAVEEHAQALSDLADRAARVGYAANPWATAAGPSLEGYLTTPVEQMRAEASALRASCEAADAAVDPATPPLPDGADLAAIAAARSRVADELERVCAAVPIGLRTQWATAGPATVSRAAQAFADAAPLADKVESTRLDGELLATVRSAPPTIGTIATQTAALDAYVETTKKLFGFLAYGKKSAAAKVLATYGLQPTAANAARVAEFLAALKIRLRLKEALAAFAPNAFAATLPDDQIALAAVRDHRALLEFIGRVHADAALADVRALVLPAVASTDAPADLLRGLRATAARVGRIKELESRLAPKLFSEPARRDVLRDARAGRPVAPAAAALAERFDSLEDVLRVREGSAALPAALRPAAARLVEQNVSGDVALGVLRKAADANEMLRRLKADRLLMTVDGQNLQSSFARYQQLDAQKKQLTRAAILHRWATRQRERLLAATGSRLGAPGADLRRRLTIRGERAMRLRQVIRAGQGIDGGDPLYDLRPVWMASPETVAQLFPRAAVFDVVVFDEASQCRLEEALPVMLRAKRVVIAGDPKQLPPTRFFESAVASSDDELAEIEGDQQLFESQQGEIEDLLAAALNIEIDECYLDVHYRSRNADLIEFSNGQFYGSRLQAIPGHPRRRARFAPLTLYPVNGTYDKRTNVAEAEQVCRIVRDLLKRAAPPSIGVACFNLAQRDLIAEKLEDLAADDAEFGRALAAARERRSASAFEGLFVKNLENVQGDERDHLIVSTTYGPDAKGKFYRRFGPVGTAGGGRRLNVLVTRARDEVHLVTSIPPAVYRHLPPVPPGQTPGGAWLLFAYLVYAEKLAEAYERGRRQAEAAEAPLELAAAGPTVEVRPSRFPSTFAEQFARRLQAGPRIGSDVHWGNDGFCVDLALHHPRRPEDVTLGVLCDLARFDRAADPIEWEVFRTAVLEAQGWTFHRIWTPHFFRDAAAATANVAEAADVAAAADDDPRDIRVVS